MGLIRVANTCNNFSAFLQNDQLFISKMINYIIVWPVHMIKFVFKIFSDQAITFHFKSRKKLKTRFIPSYFK